MKDNELLFDRKSHVLYSKPCKKEILATIALHLSLIHIYIQRNAPWSG